MQLPEKKKQLGTSYREFSMIGTIRNLALLIQNVYSDNCFKQTAGQLGRPSHFRL